MEVNLDKELSIIDDRDFEELLRDARKANHNYDMITGFGGISAEDLNEWKYGDDYERFGK